MNNRIFELIQKQNGLGLVWSEEDKKSFAELIVKECITEMEYAENGYEDYRNQIEDGMRDHCIGLIKHKFGVE